MSNRFTIWSNNVEMDDILKIVQAGARRVIGREIQQCLTTTEILSVCVCAVLRPSDAVDPIVALTKDVARKGGGPTVSSTAV